jgi:WD40 repeat protein
MGNIWRGEDERLHGRPCAIKSLPLAGLSGPDAAEAIAWFDREVEVLAQLHHPAICDIRDVVPVSDERYLILELIDGHTLGAELARRGHPGLPVDDVLRWAATLADALAYLHGQCPPLVFRDLKPANVMLRSTGQVVPIDFGIARPVATAGATAIGTGAYAPPEQYQGLAEPRSDIYGLAATLHHLLTGRDPTGYPPFTFPPIRALVPGLPGALELVLQRALSLKPDDRYPDVTAFAATLAAGATGSGRGPGRGPGGGPSAAARPGAVLQIQRPLVPPDPAHSFVLAPERTVRRRSQPRGHPAPAGLVPLEGERLWVLSEAALWDVAAGHVIWELGITADEPAALSPDGSYLAQYLTGRLGIWRAFNPSATRVAGPPGFGTPVFSPDGTLLAARSDEGQRELTCWGVDGGDVALSLRGHDGPVRTLLWGPDGRTLVSASDDRTVRLWDATNGHVIHRLKGFDYAPLAITLSPDGSVLATESGRRKELGAVRLWNTATGKEIEHFHDHERALIGLAFNPDGVLLATWDEEGLVVLRNLVSGDIEWELKAHDGMVNDLTFSSDGVVMATAGDDGVVVLWDLTNGQVLHRLDDGAGTAAVTVLFRPGDDSLVSLGEEDDLVRIWRI